MAPNATIFGLVLPQKIWLSSHHRRQIDRWIGRFDPDASFSGWLIFVYRHNREILLDSQIAR
jgi:hypothetical protein